MLGEFLFRSNRIGMLSLQVVLGAVLYKALMFFGRYYGYYINLTPSDLKMLTSILVIISLIIAKSRKDKPLNTGKKEEKSA
jgi:putative tryptophan/tyrosine transport system permease protein